MNFSLIHGLLGPAVPLPEVPLCAEEIARRERATAIVLRAELATRRAERAIRIVVDGAGPRLPSPADEGVRP